jgi:murein DD-endopeptidase MepM/ murein hydrolase activator NlpD
MKKNWWLKFVAAPLAVAIGLALLFLTRPANPVDVPPTVSKFVFLTAESGYYAAEIQSFLEAQGSPLVTYRQNINGQELSAADMVWIASQDLDYGLNPKVLLTTLALETNLTWSKPDGLLEHLQQMGRELTANYRDYQPDTKAVSKSTQDTQSTPGAPSGPTDSPHAPAAALAGYLGKTAKAPNQAQPDLPSWTDTYRRLFGDPAAQPKDVQPPGEFPFLRLPFDQPAGDFMHVESFFDHYYPGYFSEPNIVRFDGQNLPGAQFKTCWSGMTCYSGHNALDYPMPTGTPLYAVAPGKIVYRYDKDGGLIIEHPNGYRTLYWHMENIIVRTGQVVVQGQLLGISGNRGMSTGPHLHFGLRMTDLSADIDPFGWWNTEVKDPYTYPSRFMWQGDLVADNREAQAQLFYYTYWWRDPVGYLGESWYTKSVNTWVASTNWGIWSTYISQPGDYMVMAYWPKNAENTESAAYRIFTNGKLNVVKVSQRADGDRWVTLGTYHLESGQTAVILTDRTDDPIKYQRVYFDAVQWVPLNPVVDTIYLPIVRNEIEGK